MSVILDKKVKEIFDLAKEKKFAIPAANVVGTNSINAAMEVSKQINSPIIIQFSYGGAAFNSGKSIPNKNYISSIKGACSGAYHIHKLSELYGANIIIHTDHCYKENLEWIDGMIRENEIFFKEHSKPLFSSHMIDLSSEPLEKNISTCKEYLKRLSKMGITLEIELGVTGGEEDGVNNENIETSKLYTTPKDVEYAYSELLKISDNFTIAASFGNVHGVYKPGNVVLKPKILKDSQDHIQKTHNTMKNPVNFVFHGGSGSSKEQIRETLDYGVVKMNVDTDLQFAFMKGVRDYFTKNKQYLSSQIGNPEGKDIPNKKYYDPRVWLREGEESFKEKLIEVCRYLNNINIL